jgi:hypothetical protein
MTRQVEPAQAEVPHDDLLLTNSLGFAAGVNRRLEEFSGEPFFVTNSTRKTATVPSFIDQRTHGLRSASAGTGQESTGEAANRPYVEDE